MAMDLFRCHSKTMRSGKIKWNKFKYESKMECMLCHWEFHEEHRHIQFANKSILLAGKEKQFDKDVTDCHLVLFQFIYFVCL